MLQGFNKQVQEPNYKLSRGLKTIAQIWQEYKYGINGQPSIESLNKQYGSMWRADSRENKFYSLRNHIYKAILKSIQGGKSEHEAIQDLETMMVSKGLTLTMLQRSLT